MNKLITSSLLIAGLTSTAQATTLDEAFKNGTTTGQLRLGYISNSPDVAGNATTTGGAIGGEIKFETAKWNRLQLAIAPYFVEKIDALTDDTNVNGDFFDANNQGYAYLGEAYINYEFNNGSVRLGRQKLDTPFINTDDIRMFSNTFNAVWLNMALTKSMTLDVGQVSSWAGFDSGSSQEKFKKASNDGVTAVGFNYNHSDALSAQAWYYNFDQKYTLLYVDANYATGPFEFGVQSGNYTEKKSSGTEGTVLGASVSYTTGPLTLAAVVNTGMNANGKSADLGLGGGNYYAAMDETTIAGKEDVKAHVLAAEYAITDKFTASVAVGHFENKGKTTNIDETDVVIDYNIADNFNLSFIHAMVDNKGDQTDAGTNFSRQTMRLTYTF